MILINNNLTFERVDLKSDELILEIVDQFLMKIKNKKKIFVTHF